MDRLLKAGVILIVIAVMALALNAVNLPFVGRDFISFWTGAQALRAGHSPYDQAFQMAVQQANGWDTRTELFPFHPYVYPPWLAILIWPLTWLPYRQALAVWLALNLVLAAVAMIVLIGVLRPRNRRAALPLAWLMLFLYLPVLHGLVVGQTHLLLLFLMTITMWASTTRHDRVAGLALGLMSIKPQVGLVLAAVFGVYWLTQRRWQAVLSLILTGLVCAAISFVFVPNWVTDMLAASDRFTALTGLPLLPSGFRDYPTVYAAVRVGLTQSPILLLTAPAALAALVLWAVRRRSIAQLPRWFSMVVLAGLLLITPYARVYELTLLLAPLLYVWLTTDIRASRLTRVAIVGCVYIWPFVMLVWRADGVWNVWSALMLTVAVLILPRTRATV